MCRGLVDVIVPTFNRADLIVRTLDTIFAQSYRPISVIVVDDGSKDDTESVVRAYRNDHPELQYHYKQNGGVASARNVGIELSRAEFIAFCDSDDLWRKDKLERQMPCFSDPAVGLVYSSFASQVDGIEIKRERPLPEGDCFFEILKRNVIPNSSVVVRRTSLDAAGRFNERRDMMGLEDKHLWVRIARKSRVKALPEPLVDYQITPQSVSSNLARMLKAELLCLADLRELFPPSHRREEEQFEAAHWVAYIHYAMAMFNCRDYVQARSCLLSALRLRPYHLEGIAYLLATYLPEGSIELIRSVKQRVLPRNGREPRY